MRLPVGAEGAEGVGVAAAGNRYATSIHTLASAVRKLSRAVPPPAGCRLHRALDGPVLDRRWFRSDGRGMRGGIELGFLSTTLSRASALAPHGGGDSAASPPEGWATLLEIEAGREDRGAPVAALSQYPHEQEVLFGPLCRLEPAGDPRLDTAGGAPLVIVRLRLDGGPRALTIEEAVGRRFQDSMADSIRRELRLDMEKLAGQAGGGIGTLIGQGEARAGKEEAGARLEAVLMEQPAGRLRHTGSFGRSWNEALALKNAVGAEWAFPRLLDAAGTGAGSGSFPVALAELEDVFTPVAIARVALALARSEGLVRAAVDEADPARDGASPLVAACARDCPAGEPDRATVRRHVRILLAARADLNYRDKVNL